MKTINIGSLGRAKSSDIAFRFNRATASIIPGSALQPRPQYCIELSGDGDTAKVYATTPNAYDRLRQLVTADREDIRLVPGMEVLGVHIHHQPRGWDCETEGRVTARRAPAMFIEVATGGIPEKPRPLYPFPEKPGIEVFGDGRLNHLVYWMSYKNLDKITLQKNTVSVTFNKVKGSVVELVVVTASEDHATRLAASIGRRTSRRLMINHAVTGIIMILANGTRLRMGSCLQTSQTTAAK